jgi:Kef-type K+ transport system membrane component KefB
VESAFGTASLWLFLALLCAVLARHLRISSALVEICVGAAAGAFVEARWGAGSMGAQSPWLVFLATLGAVLLTFLAGAELEPAVLRSKWKEVFVVGLVSFLAPFLGCAAAARFLLGWNPAASWLAGVALSTTSMAVVYAVMIETGFNRTGYGKGILAACFVTDLGTVVALGLLFAPFTVRTAVFAVACAAVLAALPFLTARLTSLYAHRTAAIRTKWVLFVLCGLGALAVWAGSEAVLPAYIAGMVLAGSAARDAVWLRRLRTLTVGFLTPFYFLRAGSLVSLPAIAAAPAILAVLLGAKLAAKVFGLYPAVAAFRRDRNERWYYILLMSTGLTFGTISAIFGYSHGIVTQGQYSFLVAAVILSAVVPTVVAGLAFLPRHLLPPSGSSSP